MPHDAFISYSRKDRAFAVQLEKALENFRPPKDLSVPQRRLDVFRDEEDFTGAEYYQSLDLHLGDAAKLIVLCSPAARASAFVNDEIRRFAGHRGPQHIIALLVDGIPNNEAGPQQEAQRAFPDALCECMAMPLAADYRQFDPKKSRVNRGTYEASWYTTLANIYGLSRAQIEQRDRRRRTRQRRVILAASIGSLAVLAGLSVVAWQQRRAADEQAKVAAARYLAGQVVAQSSASPSEGLRIRALLGAESLRNTWTDEGYEAWRRATLEMAPIVGSVATDRPMLKLLFARDARKLVGLCHERHVHVFSLDDLQERSRLEADQTAFELAIDATADHVLAFPRHGDTIQVGDVRSSTMRTVFLPGDLWSAGFGPTGDTLVAGLTDLWVIDPNKDAVQSRIRLPGKTHWVTLARDGATLLAADHDSLTAYDTLSGERSWRTAFTHDPNGTGFSLSGDGQSLLVRDRKQVATLNVVTGAVVQAAAAEKDSEAAADIALLDGNRYLEGADLFSVPGQQQRSLPLVRRPPHLTTAVASNSGRYAAGFPADDPGGFVVIDLSRLPQSLRERNVMIQLTAQGDNSVAAAAFSKDDKLLAVSTGELNLGAMQRDGELQLLSLQHPRWRTIVPQESRHGNLFVLPPNARVISKPWDAPAARAFNADGSVPDDDSTGTRVSASGRLAAQQDQGKQWIITDRTDKRTVTIPGNGSPLEFSPDERRVLVFPKLYSLDAPHTSQAVASGGPLARTWSFPGARLVIGQEMKDEFNNKPAVVFDWSTGRVVPGPRSTDFQYAVAPDGVHFVTYDVTDGLRLWAVGANAPLLASEAVVDNDKLLTFNASGTLLAVGSCGSVALYDARTLRLQFRIRFEGECFAGFSSDGNYLLSRHMYRDFPEPTLHPLTLAGVLAETCAKVTTNLSSAEWKRYSPRSSPTETCAGTPAQRVLDARRWSESR